MLVSLLRSILLVALVPAAAAAQGNVLVVGPGGFSQIQDAVLAAQDGDTILVKSTHPSNGYQAVEIDGKALTIVTDTGVAIPTVKTVHVHDLPEGKTVVLSRLGFATYGYPILLQNNAGSVRLVRCHAQAAHSYYRLPALRIADSTGTTALAACTLRGGDGIYEVDGFDGGVGL
jgi:hypothetical protein